MARRAVRRLLSWYRAQEVKPWVFWPPFLFLISGAAYGVWDADGFTESMSAANTWVLGNFGNLFCITAFAMLMAVIAVPFSPLGRVRIGGPDAKPLLTRWRWFSIMLCTTVAVGILFWAAAEPLYHLMTPPRFAAVAPESQEAARYSLATMFLHWTFTPYAIYTVPALVFALAYYNGGASYSLGSLVQPLIGREPPRAASQLIDAVCLYSLVAGMAAALGTGMLTIAGGADKMLGIAVGPVSLGAVGAAIVACFVASSVSGLMNGIRMLSDWNVRVFFAIAGFVLLLGPTMYILTMGAASFGQYLITAAPRTLALGTEPDVAWVHRWTVFYWAVWMAWAPVTALFLGKIAYGYTVREFVLFNLVLPSLFCVVWMSIFGGSSLFYQSEGVADLYQLIQNQEEQGVYGIFEQLPLTPILNLVFLGVSFLSFVTAADSNTTAMSGISSSGVSPESPEPSMGIKIMWGSLVGVLAWVMVSFARIQGIKMSSNLGGFPALFLLMVVTLSLVTMMFRAARYATPSEINPAADSGTEEIAADSGTEEIAPD